MVRDVTNSVQMAVVNRSVNESRANVTAVSQVTMESTVSIPVQQSVAIFLVYRILDNVSIVNMATLVLIVTNGARNGV